MTLTYTNLTSLHDDDAWRIAIHEAGHAIAGVRFEKTFDSVEIGESEHGQVHWTHDPFDSDAEAQSLDDVRTWQTIYAAGAAAEQAYFGEIRRHAIRCDQICHIRMDKRRKEGTVDLFENAIERALSSNATPFEHPRFFNTPHPLVIGGRHSGVDADQLAELCKPHVDSAGKRRERTALVATKRVLWQT